MTRSYRHHTSFLGNRFHCNCHCNALWCTTTTSTTWCSILLMNFFFGCCNVIFSNGVEAAASGTPMVFEEWLLLHKPKRQRQRQRQRQRGQDNSTTTTTSSGMAFFEFYPTKQEFYERRDIYEENLSRWELLNRVPGGARYGPETEPFADRTPEEFAKLAGSCYREESSQGETESRQQAETKNRRNLLRANGNDLESDNRKQNQQETYKEAFTIMDVDWRAHAPPALQSTSQSKSPQIISYVTPVKNQGPHGTCWSFAAAENLEGLGVRQGQPLQNISEQEFISCCSNCQGASAEHTFLWLRNATDGVPALEESYPYVGNTSVPCLADTAPRANFQLHSWGRVVDEDQTGKEVLKALQQHGPMGLGVDARCFHGYQGGVVRECQSDRASSVVNHAVLMVAAGTDLYYYYDHHDYQEGTVSFPKAVDFFVIKNSWGKAWGEDGYVRIERGKNWWGPINVIYTQ